MKSSVMTGENNRGSDTSRIGRLARFNYLRRKWEYVRQDDFVIPWHDTFLSVSTGSITITHVPNCSMVLNYLLPENTVFNDGKGPVVDLGCRPGSRRYLTLGITRITEHQLLEVSVWGSPDGDNWESGPLAKFPSKFYCGVYTIPLDFSARPDVRFLRVQWNMSRWPKGEGMPLCDFYVCVEELESRMRAAVA